MTDDKKISKAWEKLAVARGKLLARAVRKSDLYMDEYDVEVAEIKNAKFRLAELGIKV